MCLLPSLKKCYTKKVPASQLRTKRIKPQTSAKYHSWLRYAYMECVTLIRYICMYSIDLQMEWSPPVRHFVCTLRYFIMDYSGDRNVHHLFSECISCLKEALTSMFLKWEYPLLTIHTSLRDISPFIHHPCLFCKRENLSNAGAIHFHFWIYSFPSQANSLHAISPSWSISSMNQRCVTFLVRWKCGAWAIQEWWTML